MKKYFLLIFIGFFIKNLPDVDLILTDRQICDLELLMVGGYAPLNNFMNRQQYESVLNLIHLDENNLFSLPVILDINDKIKNLLQNDLNKILVLKDQENFTLAKLKINDIWSPDKALEAKLVYGTQSLEHPGVFYLIKKTANNYVSGDLEFVSRPKYYDFNKLRLTPLEVKNYLASLGVKNVVAFQTRNPIHRAHKELISRAANEIGAHALIHPVVGPTKPGDVDYVTRVKCYQHVITKFNLQEATLALLPYSMRMAGPKEALMHALIRKNYGATHFIVGRDHAGPGKDSKGVPFYEPYEAQELAQKMENKLGLKIVSFQEMVYVQDKDIYKQISELDKTDKPLTISGTELREILRNGYEIPVWFTYPEVANELRKVFPEKNKQGITVFFTGLSSSGKSTLANALAQKLESIQDRKITILDGDRVRNYLSKELGFSKEHRSLNVRRVGFVANEITKNGGIAICALIAPYNDDRLHNKDMISANGLYLEVYVSTSLDECESRDVKGLYKLAREGKIPQFTGINDPYEIPTNSNIVIDTSKCTVEEAVNKIVDYLIHNGYLVN